MSKLNIVTWNVNGIRAVSKKGFLSWLNKSNFDVICLQEIKANREDIPEELLNHKKYTAISHSSTKKKGYSGVMTLTKKKPLETQIGLKKKKFAIEGRTLIHHFEKYILLNCYFPNGQRDHGRVPYKLEYSEEIRKLSNKLQKEHKKPILICGDYNTAHHEIDLKNPKTNKKTTGFLPIEREWIDKFYKHGYRDCFRELNPEKKDVYSWWSYRGGCRERNVGWRIDYFFTNKEFLENIKKCEYLYKIKGSDHCPVKITFNI